MGMDKVVTRILCYRNMFIHCHRHHQWNTFKQFRPHQQIDIAGRNLSHFRQCHDDAASKDSLKDSRGEIKKGKHEGEGGGGGEDIGDHRLSPQRRILESKSSVNYQGNIEKFEDISTPNTRSSTIAENSFSSPESAASNRSIRSSSSSSYSSSSSNCSSSSSSDINKNNSMNDSSVRRLPSSDEEPVKKEPPVAPDPETCCESGCVNCVWIKYAEEVKDYYPDHEEKLKEILDMIEDYNVKMFVRMELGMKK